MTANLILGKRPLEDILNERAHGQQCETFSELDIGGRIRFTPPHFGLDERPVGEKAHKADPIVHETNNPTEYITVHYQNGNYDWFEFNFRIRDGTAYLGSVTRVERVTDSSRWVPGAVVDAINKHHPELEVVPDRPPWWE